jgi:RHS repeat-associated protein
VNIEGAGTVGHRWGFTVIGLPVAGFEPRCNCVTLQLCDLQPVPYTYTLGVTYNSITSTQLVTSSVTGPTPTPPPTGIEQVAIDYSYDPLYRLTRATYSGSLAASYAYSYDAVGNRLTQTANGNRTTYTYDNANRLTSVNGQAYAWDNNGNLTSDGLLAYSYDQANRLKQVTQGANTYTFAYNGVGDRLSQTVGVTTTRYVLDPAAGLTQVLADGTNTYLYGYGRLAQYQTAMQYFGADGLGSVRQLYDATGQVLANNRYDPYGSVMSQYGEATSVFGFTGEAFDAATGLEYLRARYYSSVQGRFATRDVWAGDPTSPMSYNAWSYVYGNPVNSLDPSGQCTGIAPWTDFLGAALSSSGSGLSALPGYLDAARAAGQKAGENCAQNLAMASTRFQQGNYGSSVFYASGLNTALNESAAWLADHDAHAGLGWWANWFTYQDRLENSRFLRMYYADRYTWWMRLRPEDLPDLLEDADAVCQIGGTGLTIASFLVPAGYAVKAGLMRGPGASGASSALNKLRLAEDLARQEQASGTFAEIIAGAGSQKALRDAPRLASTYGGNPADYAKVVGPSHILPSGAQMQYHWYQNVLTGQVLEIKPVFTYPK